MSDWADEKAKTLGDYPDRRSSIATALRQARADALEEAAKVAAKNGWGVTAMDILSLKDKQP